MSSHASPNRGPVVVPAPVPAPARPLATPRQRLVSLVVDMLLILGPWVPPVALGATRSRGANFEPVYVGLCSLLAVVVATFAEAIAIASDGRTLGMRYVGLALAHSRDGWAVWAKAPSPIVFAFDVVLVLSSLFFAAFVAIALTIEGHSDLTPIAVLIALPLGFAPNLAGLLGREPRTLADRITDVCVVVDRLPVRTGRSAMVGALAIDLLLCAVVGTPCLVTFVVTFDDLVRHAFGVGAGVAIILVFAVFEVASLSTWGQTMGMRAIGALTRAAASRSS